MCELGHSTSAALHLYHEMALHNFDSDLARATSNAYVDMGYEGFTCPSDRDARASPSSQPECWSPRPLRRARGAERFGRKKMEKNGDEYNEALRLERGLGGGAGKGQADSSHAEAEGFSPSRKA